MTEGPSDWPWVPAADTFWQLIVQRARCTPDDVLLVDEHGEQVTCAQRGERVGAVVVPRSDGSVTLADVGARLLDAGLMRQKLPEQLELVPELPRTGLAKVAEQQLRDQFAP